MHGPDGTGSFGEVKEVFLNFISSYGWILAGIVALYFVLRPRVHAWLSRRAESATLENPDTDLLRRQQEARDRLQAQYDQAALVYSEKQKEKEAEALRKRIEERLRTSTSSGYRLGSSPSQDANTVKPTIKKPPGPRLRGSDYNPLSGSSGSSGYRPSGSGRSCGPQGG